MKYGLLKISGKDARKLLQGQLTCDIEKLTPGITKLAAHCNREGRVISLFHLISHQESYYFLLPISMVDSALNALKKYAIFYQVVLENISAALSYQTHIGDLTKEKISACDFYFSLTINMHVLFSTKKMNEGNISEDTWAALYIEHQLPNIYPETSSKFLPHELNLPALNAIDFDKGCYTGQEIIARMHYRGKLKKHLYPAEIAEKPADFGAPVYCDINQVTESVGYVIDYAQTGYNKYNSLIVIDDIYAKNAYLFLSPTKKYFTFKK